LAALALLAASGMSRPAALRRGAAFRAFPRLTLWAWESPQNLRALDPRRYGVAYLDQTITLSQKVYARPRVQRLLLPAGTRVMAVVRIVTTALASWCSADDWIGGLPVDEAVPMFFRMGRDSRPSNEPGWRYPIHEPLCETSAGVSTDEPWPAVRPDQRIYVFHPRAWSAVALDNLDAKVKR
jgi:hypothetical protein